MSRAKPMGRACECRASREGVGAIPPAGDNETILDYWLLSGEMQLIQFQGKYRGPRVRMRYETLDSMLEHVAGRLGVEATRTPVPTAPMKGGARSERIRRIRRHLAEGASKWSPGSALVRGT